MLNFIWCIKSAQTALRITCKLNAAVAIFLRCCVIIRGGHTAVVYLCSGSSTIHYSQPYRQLKQVLHSQRDRHGHRDFMILRLSRKITVISLCALTLVSCTLRPEAVGHLSLWTAQRTVTIDSEGGRRTSLQPGLGVPSWRPAGLWQIWKEQKGSHR